MVIDEVIVEPLGFFERADGREAETFYQGGGAVIFGGDGDDDAVDFELGERVCDHGLASGGHDAVALGAGNEPIGGKGHTVGPVDAVVPDDADELSGRPDAGRVGAGLFAVAQRLSDKFLRMGELRGGVDPRQPGTEGFTVGLDEGEERGGVGGLEQAELEAGINLVAQHRAERMRAGGARVATPELGRRDGWIF